MTSDSNVIPIEPGFGFARTRSLAFDAVRKLWRIRRSQGMTQAELALRLDRDEGWVSKKLSGPANWTLRTLGDLIDALDGEIEITVLDLRIGQQTDNYDAYAGYGEKPIENVRAKVKIPPPSPRMDGSIRIERAAVTNSNTVTLDIR